MATFPKKKQARTSQLRSKRLFPKLLLAMFVVVISIWGFVSYYTFQTYTDELLLPRIKIWVSAPKYLSTNEEEEIRFAIENLDDKDIQANFLMVNGSSIKSFLGLDQSNILYSGKIKSQEQVNQHLNIFLPWESNRDEIIGFSLWGGIDGSEVQKIDDLEMGIAPVPWSRSLSNYLGITLVGLVFGLIKNSLGANF